MTDAADARPIPTAWCVITGPPSAGKTTLIEARARGEAILGAYRRLGYSPERIPTCWADDTAGAVAARLSIILSRHP